MSIFEEAFSELKESHWPEVINGQEVSEVVNDILIAPEEIDANIKNGEGPCRVIMSFDRVNPRRGIGVWADISADVEIPHVDYGYDDFQESPSVEDFDVVVPKYDVAFTDADEDELSEEEVKEILGLDDAGFEELKKGIEIVLMRFIRESLIEDVEENPWSPILPDYGEYLSGRDAAAAEANWEAMRDN